jgi:hypothetical protein
MIISLVGWFMNKFLFIKIGLEEKASQDYEDKAIPPT